MELRLDGKVALVTGGSRGIGRGCAVALAEAGADVAINYHSRADAAEEVRREIEARGRRAIAVQADVADRAAVEALVEQTERELGPISVLIANAVSSTRKTFLETDEASFRRTLDVALMGNFHVCQAVARRMAAGRIEGSIIIVGSTHAVYAFPKAFDYNVAKAALHHMAMTMANELASHRIRVNLLVPGWTDTPGERQWLSDEELYREGAKLPFGRLATPEDVAPVAVFLASDAARYVSGSVYRVDGALEISMPSGGSSAARQ